MPLITDKFGKASINTDTAVATTVKTTRLPGVFVLEAFDLSKFAQDTPVFVVTYKKTTDPGTGVVSISNLVSWKALVNPGANTLTNLTVQPGYVDAGNAVGDFIECIPTSAWENSLIDGILTSLNPDGTLKTSAVQTALGLGGGSLNGWNVLGFTPNSIVDNGNRNYTATLLGVNKTDTLSPGTRVLGVRSTAAPTYMSSILNGSSQYFTKVSPTGALGSVTDNFTIMGWLLPGALGVDSTPISRSDATNANSIEIWQLADGRIRVTISNGGASNSRHWLTNQSVTPGKKVHIAVTWAAGVGNLYLDGVLTASAQTTGGTAPTVAGTGGDFSIGRRGASASAYYNGQVSGVGFFNTVLSAATIRQYKNQVLTGAEANCIGAWNLNNTVVNQVAPGTNDLTSMGGAGFVSGVSPYATNGFDVSGGSNEYGIVMTSVFTGGNTVLTIQCPEGCALPTIGTLSSLQYSSAKVPYGFPASIDRHAIETWLWATYTSPGSPSGIQNTQRQIFLPQGEWIWQAEMNLKLSRAASGIGGIRVFFSNSPTTDTHPQLSMFEYRNALMYWESRNVKRQPLRLTAPTTFTLLVAPEDNGAYTDIGIIGNYTTTGRSASFMRAENAYL